MTMSPGAPRDRETSWGLSISLLLHGVIGGVLLFSPAVRRLEPVVEPSLSVEFVTAGKPTLGVAGAPRPLLVDPDGAAPPARPPTVASDRPPKVVAPAPTPPNEAGSARPAGGMISATQLFSGKILASPQSRQARESLRHMAKDERIEQICNIEAQEQIRKSDPDFQPDIVIAYAMADTSATDRTLAADGGAFRSKKKWFAIRYTCEVTADLSGVASFAFRIGAAIPKRDWASHNLTIDDGPLD